MHPDPLNSASAKSQRYRIRALGYMVDGDKRPIPAIWSKTFSCYPMPETSCILPTGSEIR